MTLQAKFNTFDASLTHLEAHIAAFVIGKPAISGAADFSFTDECMLEGLLSRVWQAWGSFCRDCIVESCLGTTTASGAIVPQIAGALSEQHVSGAAICAWPVNPKTTTFWGKTNSELRKEPTWGDVDLLIRIVPRLKPANATQMVAAFSSSYPAAKALQKIRNCAAHNNHQTMLEVTKLAPSYISYPIGHAAQAMFWEEPASKDYLLSDAVAQLRNAASGVIA